MLADAMSGQQPSAHVGVEQLVAVVIAYALLVLRLVLAVLILYAVSPTAMGAAMGAQVVALILSILPLAIRIMSWELLALAMCTY